jgi:hypothetical protein
MRQKIKTKNIIKLAVLIIAFAAIVAAYFLTPSKGVYDHRENYRGQ